MIVIDSSIRARNGRYGFNKRKLESFLSQASRDAELHGSVSVLLTGDEEIRRLNKEFRGKDTPTDVLSFPAANPSGRSRLAGDLAISVEAAAREAKERGHALDMELRVLLLHGVLHLAGFDHETDTGQMARKENLLRKKLGIGDGLIDRANRITDKRSRRV